MEGKTLKLTIWDTAGQERFRTITSSYYRGAHAVLLVFDLTNADSFRSSQRWLSDISRYSSGNAPIILIGNKSDLLSERQVNGLDAESFADERGLRYVETSAKDSTNVDLAFAQLGDDLLRQLQKEF